MLDTPKACLGKIVVIEDDPVILGVISDMLRLKGYAVTPIQDPALAIEAIGHVNPDLVITDFFMPNLHGGEVARLVKAAHPQVPVALLTGSFTVHQVTDLADKGIDMVLQKPISWQRLLEAVAVLLKFRQTLVAKAAC